MLFAQSDLSKLCRKKFSRFVFQDSPPPIQRENKKPKVFSTKACAAQTTAMDRFQEGRTGNMYDLKAATLRAVRRNIDIC